MLYFFYQQETCRMICENNKILILVPTRNLWFFASFCRLMCAFHVCKCCWTCIMILRSENHYFWSCMPQVNLCMVHHRVNMCTWYCLNVVACETTCFYEIAWDGLSTSFWHYNNSSRLQWCSGKFLLLLCQSPLWGWIYNSGGIIFGPWLKHNFVRHYKFKRRQLGEVIQS